MPRTRKLTPPIQLKDGRQLETLADVRKLMLALPESRLQNGHWVYAGELLMAAATRKGVSLHDVQPQLSIALKAEGLIWTWRPWSYQHQVDSASLCVMCETPHPLGPARPYHQHQTIFRIGGFDGTGFEPQRLQHSVHRVVFHKLRGSDDPLRVNVCS
jgi:hypothetical protein